MVAAEPLSQLDEQPEDVVLLFADDAGRRHKEPDTETAAVAALEAATAAAAAKHVSACFNNAADS